MIKLYSPMDIQNVAPRVAAMLGEVAEKVGYTTDKILSDLYAMKSQLWVVDDFQGVIVTSILHRPLEKVLFVDWLVGKDGKADWLSEWEAEQESFARGRGCTAVEFRGRRGWKKHQREFDDYKPVMTVYRKDYVSR